jgi:hypothetical protein
MSVEFYKEQYEYAGKYGRTSPYSRGGHYVRDGEDVLKVYSGEEAIRIRPDGTARLTIAKDRGITWYKDIGDDFGILKISANRGIKAKDTFTVAYNDEVTGHQSERKHQGWTVEGVPAKRKGSWNLIYNENIKEDDLDHAASRQYLKDLRREFKIYEASLRLLGLDTWPKIREYRGTEKRLLLAEKVAAFMNMDFEKYVRLALNSHGYKWGDAKPSDVSKSVMLVLQEVKAEVYRQKGFV